MAPASPPAVPTRKRSQLQQDREETIQQHTVPCLGVAPVKRRRSSASSAEEQQQQQQQPPTLEEQHQPTVEEDQRLLDGAPQTELFLVTVKTRDELDESADAAAEAEALDKLLQLKQQQQQQRAAAAEDADVTWGHEFAALDSLRRFAKHHQDQARRQL